jgi:hypothetical protein
MPKTLTPPGEIAGKGFKIDRVGGAPKRRARQLLDIIIAVDQVENSAAVNRLKCAA